MSADDSRYYRRQVKLFTGACVLYLVEGHNKPNWNVRIKIPGRKGYVRRSLKTTDEAEAITLGTQLYLKLRAKADQGLPVDVPKVSGVWKEYLRWREASGWGTFHATQWHRRYGEEWLSQFSRLDEIHQRDIDFYFSKDGFRLNYAKNNPPKLIRSGDTNWNRPRWTSTNQTDTPSYNYLNGEISIMRSFFRFCVERGYMGAIPILNNPLEHKARSGSNRGCFSLEQYRSLVAEIRHRCNKKGMTEGHTRTINGVEHHIPARRFKDVEYSNERLRTWILLLSATGLRPQEARQLRWRNIRTYKKDGAAFPFFTLIEVPAEIAKAKYKGRRTGREVFSFDGDLTYRRLMERWRPYCPTPEPDGLIFPSARDHSKAQCMVAPFNRLLKKMRGGSMLTDEEGLPLSSYSLRHFYITQRIKAGVPLSVIAKNCGHMVSTLEQTYNRLLARDMVEVLVRTNFQQHRTTLQSEDTQDI